MNLDLKRLLQLSHTTSSNQEIQQITRILSHCLEQPGYSKELLPIIQSLDVDMNTTCAALIQLKEYVRKHWNSQTFAESAEDDQFLEDKQFLLDNLIGLNIYLSENYKYGKIIKDIISCFGKSVLVLVKDILNLLEQKRQFRTCMNFLLGIIGYIQFFWDKLDDQYTEILKKVIPLLNTIIFEGHEEITKLSIACTQNSTDISLQQKYLKATFQFQEMVYLGIKFIKKSLPWMNQDKDLRKYSMTWAEICMRQVDNYNRQILAKTGAEDNLKFLRGTEEFYYFHSRKWAIKYLTSFIQKILIYKKADLELTKSTSDFYEEHWQQLVKTLNRMYDYSSPKKMRYFEFDLVSTAFKVKPKFMNTEFQLYIRDILPEYIRFDKDDERVAQEDPVDYLSSEMSNSAEDWNIRKKAAELWTKILTEIDHFFAKQEKEKRYQFALKVIQNKLTSPDPDHQLCGGYLLEKLINGTRLKKESSYIHDRFQELSSIAILNFLQKDHFFFIISALGISKEMEFKRFDQEREQGRFAEATHKMGQYVLGFLTNESTKKWNGYEMVKLKCLSNIFCLPKKWFLDLNDSQIQTIMTIFLQSLLQYELEEILCSFKNFIFNLNSQLERYAIGIIKQFGKRLDRIEEPEPTYNNNSRKEIFASLQKFSTVSGIINTLSFFTNFIGKKNRAIKQVLEQELIKLLDSLFSVDLQLENNISSYIDEILSFWQQFLIETKAGKLPLSDRLWFFYSVVIYKVQGLKQSKLKEAQKLTNNQTDLSILRNCGDKEEFYILSYLKLLIVYQQFVPMTNWIGNLQDIYRRKFFHSTHMESLFLMIISFYGKSNDFENSIYGRFLSTALLIFILEEHGSELLLDKVPPSQLSVSRESGSVLRYVWLIILKNRSDSFKGYLKEFNLQLVLMWIYTLKFQCLNDSITQGRYEEKNRIVRILSEFISEVENAEKHHRLQDYFKLYPEFRRGVLGFASILKLALQIPALLSKARDIVHILIVLLKYDLHLQGYSIDADLEEEEDNEEFTEEEWMLANNFGEQIEQMESSTQTQAQQAKYEFENEPNLVFDINSFKNMSHDDELHSDLKDLITFENLSDREDTSKLDILVEAEIALEALVLLKNHHPKVYEDVIFYPYDAHDWELSLILEVMDKSEEEFKKFDVYEVYNEGNDGVYYDNMAQNDQQ